MRDEFERKLEEKQNEIDYLKGQVRKSMFDHDDQAQYIRSENIKSVFDLIYGISEFRNFGIKLN